MLAAVMPQQGFDESDHPAAELTAQVQLLPQPALSVLTSPLELIDRQATFHIEFVTDFLATGAELFGRIPPIAGSLLQDIATGTPLPTAVGRALRDFADVEFEAGRELVGFAEEWANFQIQFLRDLVAGLPAVIGGGPFGQLVTAALDVASQIVDGVVSFSNAVITAAETVVGKVLGDDAAATPPTPAIVDDAEPAASLSPVRADLRKVRSQMAPDEIAQSPDVAPTEATAPSDEGGVEGEQGSEGTVTAAAGKPEPAGLPRSIAEVRDTLTRAGLSARGEAGTDAVDSTDADDATPGAADGTGDTVRTRPGHVGNGHFAPGHSAAGHVGAGRSGDGHSGTGHFGIGHSDRGKPKGD
ncbi:hypothetical protein H7I53_17450 [Mycolicibacterium pulveris]|uniref:hypothetical protein n=1 Tax=Mycolicibacterium pulveris TaxID=36813 RepID=UPI0013D570B1|nr:hypothetical protein [Mycolicibacterium pulveris]MCV6982002.1 hypothetical protein [Mycolicibacterium pulveris]